MKPNIMELRDGITLEMRTAYLRLLVRWQQADVATIPKQEYFDSINGCYMVEIGGMFIGIEKDGYTHS
jgi:hypothetical protein